METQADLLVERLDGRLAAVTMRRPDRRNALSLAMMQALAEAFEELGRDRSVRAVILRGEGPAFSAGHDLRELRDADAAAARAIFDACVRLMGVLHAIPQPVIAQVGAIATAAGCQLVAACDLAVASTAARFATPGVRIGLFCSTPMVALSRAIGRKRALEMLLTGDEIDAQTALAWGLVNRVVPPERLEEETLALARAVVRAAPAVVALGKSAFYAQVERDERAAYDYTREVMTLNALFPEAHEGIGAFLDKRSPNF